MSSNTVLSINPEVKIVGVTTPVTVKISNPHGVRRISAYIEQGGARYPLTEVKTPAHRLFWRKQQPSQTLTFVAGKSKAPNLKEGDARLVVEADADDFAGHTDSTSAGVKVTLAPPRVAPDDAQHYINQGGMELAVMTPGGSWNEAGVKVGKYTFRSFPLAGPPGTALRHVRLSLGPAGQPYAHGVRPQRGRHGSHGPVLVQAVSEEVPRTRFSDR